MNLVRSFGEGSGKRIDAEFRQIVHLSDFARSRRYDAWMRAGGQLRGLVMQVSLTATMTLK